MVRTVALALLVVAIGAAPAKAAWPAAPWVESRLDAEEPPLKPLPQPSQHLTIQLPGMSHHFGKPTDGQGQTQDGREFNEQNWGIGIQLEHRLTGDWEEWVTKTSFGVLKDSLDAMGLYAGYVMQKRVADGASFTADVGGGAFLFYRTLQFDGPHMLIPAVLPVLSAQHKATRLGLNLVAIPPCKLSGGTMPGVIYLQFTKAY